MSNKSSRLISEALAVLVLCSIILAVRLIAPVEAKSDDTISKPCTRFAAEQTHSSKPLPRLDISRVDFTNSRQAEQFSKCVGLLTPLSSGLDSTLRHPTDHHAIGVPKALVATALKWRDGDPGAVRQGLGPAALLSIEVCWENLDDSMAAERRIVKLAAESTWAVHGNVKFVGWTRCSTKSKGISIAFRDARPESRPGNQSSQFHPSMYINATFKSSEMADCRRIPQQCIWATAVHEFGHALYFLHEHNRRDIGVSDPDCKARLLEGGEIQSPAISTGASTLGTDYDPSSIMNYCANIYTGRLQLSDCDIAALQNAYGRPRNNYSYKTQCKIDIRGMQ